ncbi:MAG: DUF1416 domain-containing protein [Desulfobacterales bacterium]|nr:DUF1416 domain-containing protein [Desulfobacterales bacterium]
MKARRFLQNMNQEIPVVAKTIVCIILMSAVPGMAQLQPANDNYADAVEITGLSGQTTGLNTDATKETGEPDHAGNSGGKSIWWTWTAPETGYFYFDTYESSFNTLLAVYTGSSVDNLTEAVSSYNDWINLNNSLTFQAQSGVKYYIAVDVWVGYSGDIVLNWRKAVRPKNDNFADTATLKGLSGQTTGSNAEATKETDEPDHAGNSGGKSVWWEWTAPEIGYFSFDTYGSSFDTLLAVYSISGFDSLTEVISNDNYWFGNNDDWIDKYNSGLIFQAQSGVRYCIAVDGKTGKTGNIVLNWNMLGADNFHDALILTGQSGQEIRSNAGTTKEADEPDHAGYSGGKSVWWTWTAPETGYFYFDTYGSSFNTLLAVYIGSGVDSLTEVAGNDDDGSDNNNSSLIFHAQSGVQYYITVDGNYGKFGKIVLSWKKTIPLAGDFFTEAITLENLNLSGQTTGSNVGATREIGEPNHGGWSGGKSVWWTWSAPESGNFYFNTHGNTHGSSFDIPLAIYTGSGVDSLTEVAGNYDHNYYNSGLTFHAHSGVQYYIAVYGKSGDIVLNWNLVVADNFDNALLLTGLSGKETHSNIGATKESGEPDHAGNSGGKSVWWAWTAPETGYFYFDTHGSDFSTLLAVYNGSGIDSLKVVASYDDVESSRNNSGLTFQAQSGVRYYIVVDGYHYSWSVANSGDIVLNWRKAVRPVNDDFADAITLEGLPGDTTGSNIGEDMDATIEEGESDHAGKSGGKSVWWIWTTPKTGYFSFDTHGSDFNTLLAVYTGSDIDSLTEIASNDDDGSISYNSGLAFQSQSGVRYYIVVDGSNGESGTVVLNINISDSDDFDDALILTGLTGKEIRSNVGATKEAGEPDHAGNSGGKSVWWAWTAPETEYFFFDTHGSDFNTLLAVYTGSEIDSLTEIAGNDDDGSGSYNSGLTFQAQSDVRYYIAVDGYYGKPGDIVLNWRTAMPPANDNFADAITLTGLSGKTTGSNVDATKETGEPDHTGNSDGKSVWWTWTAPETGDFSFDTHDSRFDTLLAVYTGSRVEDLTVAAGNDDDGIFAPNSGLIFQAQTGIRYYITVDGKYGAIVLNWRKITSAGLQLESVSETLGVAGESMEITMRGKGFDVHTEISIHMDIGNKNKIIGSWTGDVVSPQNVTVIGDTAYVADGDGGLQVIDVGNPARPVKIGGADTPGYASDVAVRGNTAYVADGEGGLQVIDVSNPATPVKTGIAGTPSYARSVAVVGDTAYVACGNYYEWYGLQVIDVSNPASPLMIGAVETLGYAYDIAVIGDTAYVADRKGLQVIDVSNPANPVKIGTHHIGGAPQGVAVIGNTAYVTAGHGLLLIDVSNPASLVVIGTVDTYGEVLHGVAVIGDTAYVTHSSGTLQVLDVSNPASPMVIGTVDTPGDANGVAVIRDTAYVADGEGGLQVIDVSIPAIPVAIGAAYTPDSAGVAVIGDTAYVTHGSGALQVIDVGNPASPVIIGAVDTPGGAKGIAVIGDTVYVACSDLEWSGLQVIDVSNPAMPVIIGAADTPGWAYDVAVIGDMAYVADSWFGGLQVIDVSNPASPVIIGAANTPNYAEGVAIIGDTAYVADRSESGGLQVIDVSNPASPVIIGAADTLNKAKGIAVIGDTAYVACSGFNNWSGLQVIDVSNPANPLIIGAADTPGDALHVAVVGDTAYVADRSGGLQVIDVSNPASPVIISEMYTPGYANDVAVIGDTAYVADRDGGLQVIDVSNPTMSVNIKAVDTPGSANGVAVIGNIAYVADGGGLQVADVSNPASPVIIGTADTPGSARSVVVIGDMAYIADGPGGLQVANVSNPASPMIIGTAADTPGYARSVAVIGDTAYVADGPGGLQVIDVSNPASPMIIGTAADTPGYASDVAVRGDTAYVACGDEWNGLLIVDVSSPESPVKIGSVDTPSWANGVAVIGDTAYVADGYRGLQVIDVSNPASPVIIGTAITSGDAEGVTVIGDMAYVADGSRGLQMIDVSNPTSPVKFGIIDTGYANDVAVIGDTAYVADRNRGLTVIPTIKSFKSFRAIKSFTVESETSISITIPASEYMGHYTLRVYNQYNESAELPGAVTFVTPEKAYLLDTKAIIVAGGSTDSDNKIWQETKKSADYAYKALLYQGYTSESIYYLTPETDLNSAIIDRNATEANLDYAVNQWTKNDPPATELLLYLVDHGGDSRFILGRGEEITAEKLDTWLDDLQKTLPGPTEDSPSLPVIFVYDACQSGTFISRTTPPQGAERIVATGASDERAYFLDRGILSFSYQFWDSIYNGYEVGKAFSRSRNQMEQYQSAQIDANGNGIPNEPEDESYANKWQIRRSYRPAADVPYIYDLSEPRTLSQETSAKIWSKVGYVEEETKIRRVWAIIAPPESAPGSADIPVTDYPTVEMIKSPDSKDTYEAVYSDFTRNGTYNITVCAMNDKGVYSLFKKTSVSRIPEYVVRVSGFQEIYGRNSTSPLWAEINCEDNNIVKVWAEISPPSIPAELVLEDPDKDCIYRGTYSGFTEEKAYTVKIYAEDDQDTVSAPVKTYVTHSDLKGDNYECDDDPDRAKVVVLHGEKQHHSFHDSGDADWVKFYALPDEQYNISVTNLDGSCDAVIEVYDTDGISPLAKSENSDNDTGNEMLRWECPEGKDAIYFVRLTNLNPISGENVLYDLEVYSPGTPPPYSVIGGKVENFSGEPVKDAVLRTVSTTTENTAAGITREDGTYIIFQPPGTWNITAEATGYKNSSAVSVVITGAEGQTVDFVLELSEPAGDTDGNGKTELADAVLALQIAAGLNSGSVNMAADVNNDGKIGMEEAVYILRREIRTGR